MAEILIRMGPTRSDPKAWQRLLPVAVKPNGHEWGAQETWPKFAKLRITDVSVAQAQEYLDVDTEGVDAEGEPIMVGLRRWKVDLDDVNVPAAIINTVEAGNVVIVTKAQIVNFIKRVRS